MLLPSQCAPSALIAADPHEAPGQHSAGKVLAILSEIHEKRCGRKMIKPLDLTHFVTYDKEKGATTITAEVLAQLQEATKGDADGLKSIVDGLNDLHLRCLPKVPRAPTPCVLLHHFGCHPLSLPLPLQLGFGFMGSHMHVCKTDPEAKPIKLAWEKGARLLDVMDPVPMMGAGFKVRTPCMQTPAKGVAMMTRAATRALPLTALLWTRRCAPMRR